MVFAPVSMGRRLFPAPDPASLGAVILDGLVVVRIGLGRLGHVELLGASDVISPWSHSGPEIHAAVVQRLITRSRRLSLQAAIHALPRVAERVELTLWALAERFGRDTPDGITLHLPITHQQLAEIVAAQRPSVSTALNWLDAPAS